jgi:hypothetical protein
MRNYGKYPNTWQLNNSLVNDQWVSKEIRGEIKSFLELTKMKIQLIRTFGI